MKKYYGVLAVFFLCIRLCFPASVFAFGEASWIYDEYDLLDTAQEEELNEELSEIHDTYGFDAALLITGDIGEARDDRAYAAEFMQDHNMGYGETRNGMCMLHQPDARTITIVFRGPCQDIFDEKIQDIFLDDCTAKLKKEDPFGAYKALLGDLRNSLNRMEEGKKIRPMDIEGNSMIMEILTCFGKAYISMAVLACLVVWYQKRRMKTAVPAENANHYISDDGLKLRVKEDVFVRTVTTRTRIPKDEDSNNFPGQGSHGGGFQSRGESFSGSGRKY